MCNSDIYEAELEKIAEKRRATNVEAAIKGWVTQSELQEKYLYLPSDGVFIRKISIQGGGPAGTRAGHTNKKGYPRISIGPRMYFCHRLAWLYVYGEWPADLDHINGNPADFRIENLREVTSSLNLKNASLHITNTSGEIGVSFSTKNKRWIATMVHYGKTIYIGCYKSFEEACRARREMAAQYGYHENHGARRRQA